MLEVAGRTALIYVLMLVMIRVLGKRTVGNLTAFDMLVALMMGDLAGDAIYGDASMGAAVVAVVSLGALPARVERDGQVSVIRQEWAEPVQKGNAPRALDVSRGA